MIKKLFLSDSNKPLFIFGALCTVLAIIISIAYPGANSLTIFAAPFVLIATLLSNLSLSSFLGNIIS